MDTDRQADANLGANDKAISIETEDDGDPNVQPWTAAQLDSLKWLHNRLVSIYPRIRRREATDCDGPGLGYHSKLGAPSCWTPVPGKTCPGKPVRVEQWNRILLPAFISGTTPEDDMTPQEHAWLEELHNLFDVNQGPDAPKQGSAAWETLYDRVRRIGAIVTGLEARPVPPTADEIAAAVVAALPSGSVDAAVIRAACEEAVRAVFADAASP
jgi:hypothetical protein